MIKRVDVSDMDALILQLNSLPNRFMFRGQAAASWKLQSSLEVVLGERWSAEKARTFEERALNEFTSKFHLYDRENLAPSSKLGWLSVLQHYGVPTRLVDFTESPYVSLYFAIEADPRSSSDLALYALDYTAVMEATLALIRKKRRAFKETRQSLYAIQDQVFDSVVDPGEFDVAWIGEPRQFNARLDRQGGTFLVSGNRSRRVEDVLAQAMYASAPMFKFIVPGHMRKSIFALLRKMNINSKSLYGDLHGLARSIKMELQVYAD